MNSPLVFIILTFTNYQFKYSLLVPLCSCSICLSWDPPEKPKPESIHFATFPTLTSGVDVTMVWANLKSLCYSLLPFLPFIDKASTQFPRFSCIYKFHMTQLWPVRHNRKFLQKLWLFWFKQNCILLFILPPLNAIVLPGVAAAVFNHEQQAREITTPFLSSLDAETSPVATTNRILCIWRKINYYYISLIHRI